MTLEEELVALLADDAAVTAAVSDRIWPVMIRVNPVFPAITYNREGGEREYALDASVVRRRVVVTVRGWAQTYPAARELMETVATALDRVVTDGVQVATVRDGADMYIEALNVFGCTLVVELEQWP